MSIGVRKLLETRERTTQKKQRKKNLTAHIELKIVPVPTSNRGKPYNLRSMGGVLRSVLPQGWRKLSHISLAALVPPKKA